MLLLILFLLSSLSGCYSSIVTNSSLDKYDCNNKVLFVIDSSSSINNIELHGNIFTLYKFKNEINYIIDNSNIKANNIGLVEFNNNPKVILDFNYTNKSLIKKKIKNIKFGGKRKIYHTQFYNVLEFIETRYLKTNFNMMSIIFFTDTHIGNEFNQPDLYHYNIVENKFKNKYWKNDFIKRIVYYYGNKINNSVLDLISDYKKENQLQLIYEHYKFDCNKQKCIDKYCIKVPQHYHMLCLNLSNTYMLFNSHCHFFCSNISVDSLKQTINNEYCLYNKTLNYSSSTSSSSTSSSSTSSSSTSSSILKPTTQFLTNSSSTSLFINYTTPIFNNLTTISTITNKLVEQQVTKCTFINCFYWIIIIVSILIVFVIFIVIYFLKNKTKEITKKNELNVIEHNNNFNRLINNQIYSSSI